MSFPPMSVTSFSARAAFFASGFAGATSSAAPPSLAQRASMRALAASRSGRGASAS